MTQPKEDTTPVAGSKHPFDLLLCIGQLHQGFLGERWHLLLQLLHHLSQPILIAVKIHVKVALCLQDRVLQRPALDLQVTPEVYQHFTEAVLRGDELLIQLGHLLKGRTQTHVNA